MKIIPKDTKPKNYIWKKFNIKDVILASINLIIAGVVIASGFKSRFYISGAILVFTIMLFFPINNRFLYQEGYQLLKFLFSKKKFLTKKDIDRLVSFVDIEDDGYIKYSSYYGKVIEIGSKDFALEDGFLQDLDIEYFTLALNAFERDDIFDIVKIDKALILDEYMEQLVKLCDECEDETKKTILYSKLSDISLLNSENEPIYKPSYYLVVYGNKKEDIEILVDNFIENFQRTKITTKELNKKETAIFLKYNFSRNFNEREIESLEDDEIIKWIKPKSMKFHLNHFEIDDLYGQTLAIEDYPIEVGSGYLAEVFNMPSTRVVLHFKGVDQDRATRRVDRAINEIVSRQESISKASEELNNNVHVDTLKELLISLQTENERFFDLSFTITSLNYEKDNIRSFRKNSFSRIKNSGLRVNNLYSRQLEGNINSNISKASSLKLYERGMNSGTIAASFPFVFSSVLDKNGDYLGINNYGYPVILDLFKRGDDYKNSNGIVIGTSGSGKSYFLKVLITHFFANNTKIFILDPENEYKYLSNNLKGEIIDIGKGDKGVINPFHIYPVISDSEDISDIESTTKATFNAHLRTLEAFFKVILPNISDEALETLNNAIVEVYSKKGIGEMTDTSDFTADKFPIFDDLYNFIEEQLKTKKDNLYKYNIYSSVLTYISKFAKDGRYSDLWNGFSTLKTENDLSIINFQSLFTSKNNIVANAQMLLVFRFLEQQLINQKNRNDKSGLNEKTIIIVDEAHMFIEQKFPIALDFFYQMCKRIRKYGGAFIPATQSISDWNSTDELKHKTSAILKNSQYSFVFNLKGSDLEDLCDLYKSSTPINIIEQKNIVKAETGNCFFVGSENLRTSFKVDCNDLIKQFFEEGIEEENLKELIES